MRVRVSTEDVSLHSAVVVRCLLAALGRACPIRVELADARLNVLKFVKLE